MCSCNLFRFGCYSRNFHFLYSIFRIKSSTIMRLHAGAQCRFSHIFFFGCALALFHSDVIIIAIFAWKSSHFKPKMSYWFDPLVYKMVGTFFLWCFHFHFLFTQKVITGQIISMRKYKKKITKHNQPKHIESIKCVWKDTSFWELVAKCWYLSNYKIAF